MAVATGTALLIGAGASAAAGAVRSKIESDASGRATDASLQANQEALDYQKEYDARSRASDAEMWDAYNARREMLMRRYGLDIPTANNPYRDPVVANAGPQASPRAGIGNPRGMFRDLGGIMEGRGGRTREWEGGGNA